MLQEKPGDHSDWKNRLAELDAVPGEPLRDMSPSWEKLYARLHKKERGNRPFWYWVAAACVILALVVLSNPFKTNRPGIVLQNKKQPAVKIAPAPLGPAMKENTTAIEPPIADIQKTGVVTAKPIKKVHKEISPAVALHTPSIPTQPDSVQSIVGIIPADSFEVSRNTLASAAPKKKLRVIHINEITHPAGEREVIVRNAEGPGYLLKSNRNENLPKTYTTGNSSDDIFKIKLSPSNQ